MSFSTTKMIMNGHINCSNEKNSTFQSFFQLPLNPTRMGEGGLRLKDKCKTTHPNKPLLTVITVVFNGAKTIEDTIQSVLTQTYENVEYIIIDGGSTDGTQAIIKKYEDSIDYWLSEKDNGIYDAMNKGIQLASGDYVGILNSDDYFSEPNVISNIAKEFNAKNVDSIFCCLKIVDKNNVNKVLRRYRIKKFRKWYLRFGVMPPHPTFYCKRSVYLESSLYKTHYKVAADYEMMVRLFITNKISWSFLDQYMVTMRAGGVSNNGIFGQLKHNQEVVRACKENGYYTNLLLIGLKIPFRLYQLFFNKN